MKELDFDELDRAVNSLMGGVAGKTTKQQATDSDDIQTLIIPSTDDETAPVEPPVTPVNDDAAPVDAPVAASLPLESDAAAPEVPVADLSTADAADAAAAATPLAARRSGRFMDVVHPSSDMKNPLNAPSEQPSRQSTSLQPLSSDLDADHQELNQLETTTAAAPTETPSAAPVSDWPDPLADFTDTSADAPAEEVAPDMPEAADDTPVVAATELDSPAEEVTETPKEVEETEAPEESAEPAATDQPLTTPFLMDAKVDKRPLGGMTPAEAGEAEAPIGDAEELGRAPVLGALTNEALTTSDPDDQLPPSATATTPKAETALPAELQGDLMAIESDTTIASPTPSEAPAPVAVTPAPAATPSSKKNPSASIAPSAPAGPSSIQPQYKESASTGDQDNGSIYDTRGYHQPLEHPAKKKAGWLWIVWVLVILVVGAGSGAALYLLDII